jgi:acyl-coenzyme A synthetase/AMP-(fatty) acid ligase
MNVAEFLERRAETVPDRPAIIDFTQRKPQTLTFGELHAASKCAAAAFVRRGLLPGDRIVVLHPMNAALYIALAGMLRAGLVPVVCDPGAGSRHFRGACESVAPRAVFSVPAGHIYALTVPVLKRAMRFSPGDLTASESYETVECADDEPALITFSSGSTGRRKPVVRTHAHLRAQLASIRATLPFEGVDVATMPIVLLANLASGATSVIPGVDLRRPGRADPKRLARDIACTSAERIVASPAMLEHLLEAHARMLQSLQHVVTGGGPVMPSLMEALAKKIPGARITAVYGSSEAEPIAHIDYASITAADVDAMRAGAGLLAGIPVGDVRVHIRDGEILVAGDHVVLGEEERVWHRTGDGGYLDAAGRLWLTGRVQASVRDSRGTIEPFRVESALSFDPRIERSALSAANGRRVIFVQARRKAIDAAGLKRRLRWAGIDEVRCVRRLPVDRRHNAKIDYTALQAMVTR